MEVGLATYIPSYSGGLGILAGGAGPAWGVKFDGYRTQNAGVPPASNERPVLRRLAIPWPYPAFCPPASGAPPGTGPASADAYPAPMTTNSWPCARPPALAPQRNSPAPTPQRLPGPPHYLASAMVM